MKNVISILTLILLTTLWLNAQSKYEVGMQKAMDLLEEDKHLEAVALFERIGQAEKEKWGTAVPRCQRIDQPIL